MASGEMPSSSLLFTYGTLMLTTGIAAVDEAMRHAGVSLGRAHVRGHLYDLGDYPGAVAAQAAGAAGNGRADGDVANEGAADEGSADETAGDEDAPKVWGHLLRLNDPEALFAVLDPYEGFEAGNRAGSEFVRDRADVIVAGTGVAYVAQIYWYNLPVSGRARIESGDYLAHWAAKGKPRQARLP
jgi:gamma-glutamylcyclotransferase (GGCT)/AIG2-like uncharacterized protein YtfP